MLLEDKTRHQQICKYMTDLWERKNRDYGNSFSKSFEEFGTVMCAIRLEDKLNRFKNLIKNNQCVTDESIRDTLIDLANYSIMTVMELDKKAESERTVGFDSLQVNMFDGANE